jgi:hypothetical protein
MKNNRPIEVGQVRCEGEDITKSADYYTIIGHLYGKLYRVVRLRDGKVCHWYSHEILRDPVVM